MNITVFGSKGRVGSAVVRIAAERKHVVTPVDIDEPITAGDSPDVVIDFSLPSATQTVVDYCAVHSCPLVSGVTGRNRLQQKIVDELSDKVKVVCSANFSEGANLLEELSAIVAERHPDWDVDIVETHRRQKKDAPSGTAKHIAASVATKKGAFGKVTVHSLRSGTTFGTHSVIFGANGETLTLTHEAQSVDVFALGAILCAEKIVTEKCPKQQR